MPKKFMMTHFGPVAYIEDATLTFENNSGGKTNATLKITEFTWRSNLITFFGKEQTTKELMNTPVPRGFFKRLRGKHYLQEVNLLMHYDLELTVPDGSYSNLDLKREAICAVCAQVAVESVVYFPITCRDAYRWLKGKFQKQKRGYEFDLIWNAYLALPTSLPGLVDDSIYRRDKQSITCLFPSELLADPKKYGIGTTQESKASIP